MVRPALVFRLFAFAVLAGASAFGGDLLRGGAGGQASRRNPADGTAGAGDAAAAAARQNAKDRLSRTTQAMQSVKQMQAAARAAAAAKKGNNLGRNPNFQRIPLPNGLNQRLGTPRLKNVPNGLKENGLNLAPGVPKNLRRPEDGEDPELYTGAKLPTQKRTKDGETIVTIKQTDPQALLTWKTFNVGKKTTVFFNQRKAGDNVTNWIAFNRILDPSGAPSQILGSIRAEGQVYVINQNGIIFGGTSQVNTHTLVASSLPINDGLVQRGLLNNPDAQFLFSSISLEAGSKGTPAFNPATPLTADGRPGDVEVRAGARIKSPTSADNVGGRVMLVGPNVENAGTISTEDGQTILAAGLQVGIAGHDAADPSLRGLDVFIGAVSSAVDSALPTGGTATNLGLITAPRGNVTIAGRQVNQLAVIDSSTSVSFNGRIDLQSNYDGLINPNFDPASVASNPPVLYRSTGTIRFGEDSVTRILPELDSDEMVVGTELTLRSQINAQGQGINFERGSMMLAPNADVTLNAGTFKFVPSDFAPQSRFVFFGGRIQAARDAFIDVAGTPDAFVPLSQSILDVQLRGAELADSPLQRDSFLRGIDLRIDVRRNGVFNGKFFVGTPLGDAAGFVGLIQRNAGQLTTRGGSVTMNAGDSVVLEAGSTVDTSGGFFQNEGGFVRTTRLLVGGQVIDIADATPDRVYDGFFSDTTTTTNEKYGITRTFRRPLTFDGEFFDQAYIEGSDAGRIAITAPAMALDGKLAGRTVIGPRQLRDAQGDSVLPTAGQLELTFRSQDPTDLVGILEPFISPTPPTVVFQRNSNLAAADAFAVDADGKPLSLTRNGTPFLLDPDDNPFVDTDGSFQISLRSDRQKIVILSPELLSDAGFGSVTVDNRDGDVIVPRGEAIVGPVGGSLTLLGRNITVAGDITAPGGSLNFTAYNASTYDATILLADPASPDFAQPDVDPTAGIFTLARGTRLSTAGLLVDDRLESASRRSLPLRTDGGEILIEAFTARMRGGSVVDVSGGLVVNADADIDYGDAGRIAILAGSDPNLTGVTGGDLRLGGELLGFSGAKGGALELRSTLVRVGREPRRPGKLVLDPSFFDEGGFGSFSLAGIGVDATFTIGNFGTFSLEDFVRDRDPDKPIVYRPAVVIAAGTELAPVAQNLQAFAVRDEPVRVQRPVDRLSDRTPVSLAFTALGARDTFLQSLSVRGDLVMGAGASIRTDPGASVSLKGDTIVVRGGITAPGGTITVDGADSLPSRDAAPTEAFATVFIAPGARLSTEGTAIRTFNAFGNRTGFVLPGGTINLSGNVYAAAGSVLDVSGARTTIDVAPAVLGLNSRLGRGPVDGPLIPQTSGLNSPLFAFRTVPVQLDSDAGTINLEGGELLFVDSTLIGRRGGPTALGGEVNVSSGRFYDVNDLERLPTDVTLQVSQSDRAIPAFDPNAVFSPIVFLRSDDRKVIGNPVRDGNGNKLDAFGRFTADRFEEGGFESLTLDGTVEFRGDVRLDAGRRITVASGGVIYADGDVDLRAPYVEIGTPFAPPVRADDALATSVFNSLGSPFFFAPTTGSGKLTVRGRVIDIGNLSLQTIRRASFIAEGGDIRGNGTLSIAGRIVMNASQIYPTTGADFNIFAYDFVGRDRNVIPTEFVIPPDQPRLPLPSRVVAKEGLIQFFASGTSPLPLSAGGSLNAYATVIEQGGNLRAPIGSISLGFDGTGTVPVDLLTGNTLPVPVTRRLVLGRGSTTSTSAVDPLTGEALLIPYGLNVNDTSFFDPAGFDITAGGVPTKSVRVGASSLATARDSLIDLRGGGDLFAYRFVAGQGGSVDLLGTAPGAWSAGQDYEAGDLVTFDGITFSARQDSMGVAPEPNLFWTAVPERFAVVPEFQGEVAPFAPFSRSTNAPDIASDPGYVSRTLSAGDRVFLNASSALPEGDYTLLPPRYALLPGAVLVTPRSTDPRLETLAQPDGTRLVSGYRYNGLNRDRDVPTVFSSFEVLDRGNVLNRAEYRLLTANRFLSNRARALEVDVPRLPIDAGRLVLQGLDRLVVRGGVLGSAPMGGRGARIDISTPLNILVTGRGIDTATAEFPPDLFGVGTFGQPETAVARIRASLLNSFDAESLFLGGERIDVANGTFVRTLSSGIFLDNAGTPLVGPEIVLSANRLITLAPGSSVIQRGSLGGEADRLLLRQDGVLVRVSSDFDATTLRAGVTPSREPSLFVGRGSVISGTSVLLDSTYSTTLARRAVIEGESIGLNSGQITVALRKPGQIEPTVGLILRGRLLRQLGDARSLSLLSYSSFDVYGSGQFRGGDFLSINAGEIRSFQTGKRPARFFADSVLLGNAGNVTVPEPAAAVEGEVPEPPRGGLAFTGRTIELAANDLAFRDFATLEFTADRRLRFTGEGALTTDGTLTVTTPSISGGRSAIRTITAAGDVALLAAGGNARPGSGGLGANLSITGTSVRADSAISLPSGLLTLRATEGDVTVGGRLDVSGRRISIYDIVRFTDAGNVSLISDRGSVLLGEDSVIDVSSDPRRGDAGRIAVEAGLGDFVAGGTLLGGGSRRGASGSFQLDVSEIENLSGLDEVLNIANFNALRDYRIRSGDVRIDGEAKAAVYRLATDAGSIRVAGRIDASGVTGGRIELKASGSVVLADGAVLDASGKKFDAAGKGGSVLLEAGSQIDGVIDETGQIEILRGSLINLRVAQARENSQEDRGWFTGTLHLRAPRTAAGDDLAIAAIAGEIRGASSVIAEGYRLYDLTGVGEEITTGLRNTINSDAATFLGAAGTESANYGAVRTRLVGDDGALGSILTIRPGVEIVNRTGDLRLGSQFSPQNNDWNLATFRFGPRSVPGILTLRASEDLVFFNTLSDGFFTSAFNSRLVERNPEVPLNAQSWSYRLAAGADFTAADFSRVLALGLLAADKGSFKIGKPTGTGAAFPSGSNASTRNTIPRSFQVIRTGSGDIDIVAGRDIQLLNQIASIYTVGTQVADATLGGTYDVPFLNANGGQFFLGAVQQNPGYQPQFTMGGGDVTLEAGRDIARYRLDFDGVTLLTDSSRQLPINWLYRVGFVDPETGAFGAGRFDGPTFPQILSTSWWVDFSNFFEGVGALGGGNVSLLAGNNVTNVDAVVPTNARSPKGIPDAAALVELGGGDLTVRAGNAIDGGVYYVERGRGLLDAGSEIRTNSSRSPSVGVFANQAPLDQLTWLPTTLFLGKGSFDVRARGDILLGPVANPFLLPGGYNNTYWYKTYFSTYDPKSAVDVTSLGGSVTLRESVVLPTVGAGGSTPTLLAWFQNVLVFDAQRTTASTFQPWLRLNETSVASFSTVVGLKPPTLRVTAFSGDINVAGDLTLAPAPNGTLELIAGGAINGLQPQGVTTVNGAPVVGFGSSRIIVSDADPANVPGIESPFAYQSLVGTTGLARQSGDDFLFFVNALFAETGAPTLDLQTRQALHSSDLLHRDDPDPVRLYASNGSISGLTLFSPKVTRIFAGRDITDVSFYLQQTSETDTTVISAGRDILLYNANSPGRSAAVASGNQLNLGEVPLAGDIQLGGPGVLEILAGRDLDLGTGENNADGTGVGITTLGNSRNAALPFTGSSVIAIAGLRETAEGLAGSNLDFDAFIEAFLFEDVDDPTATTAAGGLGGLGDLTLEEFLALPTVRRNQLALNVFYDVLRTTGRRAVDPASPTFQNYDRGFEAIDALFNGRYRGELLTRARDVRTRSGGGIQLLAPGGGLTLANSTLGAALVPPGIVTESGGDISVFTDDSVDIGIGRIFTLRGGNQIIWSSTGDIAAGSSAKTVQSAPPTRVLLDPSSADVQTDLAGLATGGGIGVLATVRGIPPGDVDLIAPVGVVDAGDAGIRATGNLTVAATEFRNAGNSVAGGTTTGAPAPAVVSAPNVGGLTSAAGTAGAAQSSADDAAGNFQPTAAPREEAPSIFVVEVVGYGGGAVSASSEPTPTPEPAAR